jgi:hypothetical protein
VKLQQKFEFSTEAICLGKSIKTFLREPQLTKNLKVHSVFHSVINLKSDLGLLSIVTPKSGRIVTCAVIPKFENNDFLTMNVNQHTECTVQGSNLVFNERLCINFKEANEWCCVLDEGYKWNVQELKEDRLLALKAALTIYSANKSAFRKLYEDKERQLTEAISKLKLENSKDLISSAISNLIGFGPGLTPTGDDFITGFLSVITSCSETPERVINCTKKLISIGATSGSDIATGIYIGFINILEYFCKPYCINSNER